MWWFTVLLIPSVKKIFRRDQSYACTVSLTMSSLANFHPCKASFTGPNVIIEWSWVWTIPGVWEKFKFQLPDCFIGRCHRMWTCIFVEQKKLLGQQNSSLIVSHGLQPSDHKKQITACCSAAVIWKHCFHL